MGPALPSVWLPSALASVRALLPDGALMDLAPARGGGRPARRAASVAGLHGVAHHLRARYRACAALREPAHQVSGPSDSELRSENRLPAACILDVRSGSRKK